MPAAAVAIGVLRVRRAILPAKAEADVRLAGAVHSQRHRDIGRARDGLDVPSRGITAGQLEQTVGGGDVGDQRPVLPIQRQRAVRTGLGLVVDHLSVPAGCVPVGMDQVAAHRLLDGDVRRAVGPQRQRGCPSNRRARNDLPDPAGRA